MCLFVGPDSLITEKRGICRSIPNEKSKTIPVPGGAVLSSFRIESQLCPGLKSGTQRVPRHISPYYPQNSAYTDWFCPGGSVYGIPPRKAALFVGCGFSCKREDKPRLKFFMKKLVLRIYWMMLRMFCFSEWMIDFGAIGVSHCFGAQCSVYRCMQRRFTSILVSFDKHAFYLAPCGIWRCVIHLGFWKVGILSQTITTGGRKVSKKKSYVFKGRPPALFRTFVCKDQDLAHSHVRDEWDIFKSEVMEMVSSRFYWLDETMVKLYVGLAME
jgi:hypothetical protein